MSKIESDRRLIGIRQVCDMSGLSKSSILRRVKDGKFPRAIFHDGNLKRWALDEVQSWQSSQSFSASKYLPESVAAARMSLANATLFLSLVDALLLKRSELTPQRIAEYVRINYADLGEHRNAVTDALIGFIVFKLDGMDTKTKE